MQADSNKGWSFYDFLQQGYCSPELKVVMKNWYDLIKNQHGDDSTLLRWFVNLPSDPGDQFPLATVEVEYTDGTYQKTFYQKDL